MKKYSSENIIFHSSNHKNNQANQEACEFYLSLLERSTKKRVFLTEEQESLRVALQKELQNINQQQPP